jgi:hypothetical protein
MILKRVFLILEKLGQDNFDNIIQIFIDIIDLRR